MHLPTVIKHVYKREHREACCLLQFGWWSGHIVQLVLATGIPHSERIAWQARSRRRDWDQTHTILNTFAWIIVSAMLHSTAEYGVFLHMR